jgi:hypothetical protein
MLVTTQIINSWLINDLLYNFNDFIKQEQFSKTEISPVSPEDQFQDVENYISKLEIVLEQTPGNYSLIHCKDVMSGCIILQHPDTVKMENNYVNR